MKFESRPILLMNSPPTISMFRKLNDILDNKVHMVVEVTALSILNTDKQY